MQAEDLDVRPYEPESSLRLGLEVIHHRKDIGLYESHGSHRTHKAHTRRSVQSDIRDGRAYAAGRMRHGHMGEVRNAPKGILSCASAGQGATYGA